MSFLVRMNGDEPPRFPDRCVSCCDPRPNSTTIFVAREFHPAHLIFLYSIGKRIELNTPMCLQCEDRYHASRRWRSVSSIGGIGALIVAGVFTVPQLAAPWNQIAIAGFALLLLSPMIVGKAIAPFPLDPVITKEYVQYDFREKQIAEEFAALNGAEVQRR